MCSRFAQAAGTWRRPGSLGSLYQGGGLTDSLKTTPPSHTQCPGITRDTTTTHETRAGDAPLDEHDDTRLTGRGGVDVLCFEFRGGVLS